MSFAERKIDLTFSLGTGPYGAGGSGSTPNRPTSFSESGANTVKVSGHRVAVRIVKSGGRTNSVATIDVYGMPMKRMNEISTLGLKWTLTRQNEIVIEAGDDQGQMSTVFAGTISNAFVDYSAEPDVPLRVTANAGLFNAVKVQAPTSYKGAVDVATVLADLAKKGGYAFENAGVSVMLSNPYLQGGSVGAQIQDAVEQAGIQHIVDNNVLSIWNPGQSRNGAIALISKDTGMERSPVFHDKGIVVTGLWFPSIIFGNKVQVESGLLDSQQANGVWVIYQLDLQLDAQMPGGRWHYVAWCGRPGELVVWR